MAPEDLGRIDIGSVNGECDLTDVGTKAGMLHF